MLFEGEREILRASLDMSGNFWDQLMLDAIADTCGNLSMDVSVDALCDASQSILARVEDDRNSESGRAWLDVDDFERCVLASMASRLRDRFPQLAKFLQEIAGLHFKKMRRRQESYLLDDTRLTIINKAMQRSA